MKIDKKGYVTLTHKESDSVMDLLYTLEAMSGTGDDDFNAEARKAGYYANKILELKQEL